MKRTVLLSTFGALALAGTVVLAADVRQGLVSYWPFDTVDLASNLTPDVVSSNHLQLVNITDTSVVVPGKFGQAFSLNAGLQQVCYFTSPDGVDTGLPISGSAAYSILLWVNATGSGQADLRYFCESSTLDNNPFVSMGSQATGANAFSRFYNRFGPAIVNNNGITFDYTTTTNVLDGTWHHVAEVYNAGTYLIYVDGQLRTTIILSGTATIPIPPLNTTAVGGLVQAAISKWMTCEVDDLALWSRALSQAEIQSVMTNSIATPVPQFPPSISVNPLGATNLSPGDAWTFLAGVGGTRPMTYQWIKDGTNSIPGATATLALTSLTTADSGAYALVAANALGSITSAVAVLTINAFPAANITNGLISYWPLDTVIGSKTPDLVSGYDMTLVNMTAAGNVVPGKWGNAFSFANGTHTLLQRINNAGEDLPIYNKPNFTVSLWVNGDPNQSSHAAWAEGWTGGGNPFWWLGTHLSGTPTPVGGVDSYSRTDANATFNHEATAATAFDDTWHNVVYVQYVVGTSLIGRIYIDGVLDPGAANGNGLPQPIRPLTLNATAIGGLLRTSAGSWYSGLIDEVAVWNRVLSPDEVQILQVTAITNPPSRLQPLAINSFISDLPAVVQGGSTVLRWDVTKDAGQVTISPTLGDVTAKTIVGVGTNGIILTNTTTFVLTVKRGTSTLMATTTVAVVTGVAPSWILLDNFDTYTPGPLNTTRWWVDLRGNSVQIAALGANRVMTTIGTPATVDSDALLNLHTNTMAEHQLGTLFFRMILPQPGTTTMGHVVTMTDKTVRSYGDLVGTVSRGGLGAAVYPTVMVDPVGGTNAWFLGAINGILANMDFTATPLVSGAVYDVWIDITNAPMADPIAGFISDTFSVYLQKEGDPTRTLIFDSYTSDRNPDYNDVNFGFMQPNLDKLYVAGNSFTISAMFDDFYLSSGAYNATIPRAFGYSGPPLPPLQISRSGSQLLIQWTVGTLQQASAITGPWTNVFGAALPAYTFTPAGGQLFFRARQ